MTPEEDDAPLRDDTFASQSRRIWWVNWSIVIAALLAAAFLLAPLAGCTSVPQPRDPSQFIGPYDITLRSHCEAVYSKAACA